MLHPNLHWLRRIPLFWRLNLAGWGAFLIPEFVLGFASQRDAGRALAAVCLQLPIQLCITWILQRVYLRIGALRSFGVPGAAWMVILCLFLATAQIAILKLIMLQLGWRHPVWTPLEEWLIRVVFAWLVYMGWSLFYFWLKVDRAAVTEARRAQEARLEAQRMELQLLRAQLDPHFLFNGLNGIAAEIPPHPEKALEMVRELAAYLRYSLEHRHDSVTPLSEELDALSGYLKIEQTRFGERLQSRVEASAEAWKWKVPSFLLQPLVENAVKHSGQSEDAVRQISIGAAIVDGALAVEVRSTGRVGPGWDNSTGVGLQTLRRRLALHYPGRHHFTLSQSGEFVSAKLELEGDPCFV